MVEEKRKGNVNERRKDETHETKMDLRKMKKEEDKKKKAYSSAWEKQGQKESEKWRGQK